MFFKKSLCFGVSVGGEVSQDFPDGGVDGGMFWWSFAGTCGIRDLFIWSTGFGSLHFRPVMDSRGFRHFLSVGMLW